MQDWHSSVWRSWDWLGCRCGRRIASALAQVVRGSVDLVDVLHVEMVEEVEGFNAGFGREPLGELEDPLQAHIGVEIGGAAIGIATDGPGTVGEGKTVAVHIESREDGEVAWTLNRVEHRYLEVAQWRGHSDGLSARTEKTKRWRIRCRRPRGRGWG